jgi:hypothetical protein
MMFNTWTGGNGTATINLPRAGDNEGRLLRFKSDGTISSNKSIALTPVITRHDRWRPRVHIQPRLRWCDVIGAQFQLVHHPTKGKVTR